MSAFQIHNLSPRRYGHTVLWSVIVSILIVCVSAALGRAARNFKAALIDAPDVAVYLLLPDEHLGNTTLIKQNEEDTVRSYLAESANGPKVITLRKNEKWYVDLIEPLHASASQGEETPPQQ